MSILSNSLSMEQTNEILKANGMPTYEDAFTIAFRVKKKHFFIVEFGDVKFHAQQPHFSTSGGILNHIRSDWKQCGQCQPHILPKHSLFRKFFDKWDILHTKRLTMEQYKELLQDLKKLKEKYPHINNDRFSNIVEFDREMSK